MNTLHSMQFAVPAAPESVAVARHQVRDVLRTWDVSVDLDITMLLVSEVVTNAIVHAASPTCHDAAIQIDVVELAMGVLIATHDSDRREHDAPDQASTSGDQTGPAESGRGLILLKMLSSSWGVIDEASGKCVYFVLAFDWRFRLLRGTRSSQLPHPRHPEPGRSNDDVKLIVRPDIVRTKPDAQGPGFPLLLLQGLLLVITSHGGHTEIHHTHADAGDVYPIPDGVKLPPVLMKETG